MDITKDDIVNQIKNVLGCDDTVIDLINEEVPFKREFVDIKLGNVTFRLIRRDNYNKSCAIKAYNAELNININGKQIPLGKAKQAIDDLPDYLYSVNVFFRSNKILENGFPKMVECGSFDLDESDYKSIQSEVFKLYPKWKEVDSELKTLIRDNRLSEILSKNKSDE